MVQIGRCEVHHLTYDRFKNELLTDLQLLCVPCHKIADQQRQQRNQQMYREAGEEARDAAGMNTYFTKKYGEDWWMQDDPETFHEEWDEWKRQKQNEW